MKDGFTLIELLAVIVILAVIMIIAVPMILNTIDAAKKGAIESDAKLIIDAIEKKKASDDTFIYTDITKDNIGEKLGIKNTNYGSIKVTEVDGRPSVVIEGQNKYDGYTAYGTYTSVEVVPSDEYEEDEPAPSDYVESEGVNKPKLATGMTAIKWDGSTWIDIANPDTDTSWYNYASKEWANARTQDGSMWVWIPRYAYQIATYYHTNTAETVNIKFLKDNTNTASDNTEVELTPTYSGSSQTNFIKHPAFSFGGTELTGIWIAKFEMSGTTSSLDSKPGVASIVNIIIGNMFTASRNMETNNKYGWGLASGTMNADGTFPTDTNNVDTHMMKNFEWGAVAYLAQSVFGVNTEITINTGTYAGGGIGTAYTTNVGQSTAGTVYGIYDISGNAAEYVMGNYSNTAGSSGLIPSDINDKYINRYTAYDNAYYGDAMYETSSTSPGGNSWYSDYSQFPTSSNPWFFRGGYVTQDYRCGAFNFNSRDGGVHPYGSWRTVLLVGSGL